MDICTIHKQCAEHTSAELMQGNHGAVAVRGW